MSNRKRDTISALFGTMLGFFAGMLLYSEGVLPSNWAFLAGCGVTAIAVPAVVFGKRWSDKMEAAHREKMGMDRGFTLVELMVVVVILGILAVGLAVTIWVFSGAGEFISKVGNRVTQTCTPGQTSQCPLRGGANGTPVYGVQTCLPDGSGFGPCQ